MLPYSRILVLRRTASFSVGSFLKDYRDKKKKEKKQTEHERHFKEQHD